MRDRAILVIASIAVFLFYYLVDRSIERHNNTQNKIDEYTGIKDEDSTDDFLPW